MEKIMLDLETLGTGTDSVIVAIGAVKFDMRKGLGEEFYTTIDIDSSLNHGLRVNGDTIKWWMNQSEEARAVFADTSLALPLALDRFTAFVDTSSMEVQMWGNGSDFDCAILAHAYRVAGHRQPWKFYNSRCYRTLKNMMLHIRMGVRSGTHHNALDDARTQAEHAVRLLREQNRLRGIPLD